MNAFAFKVIDAINRDGMDNGSWGLVKDVDNTSDKYVLPWIEAVKEIAPRQVMIYTIDRETPDHDLQKATHEELNHIVTLLEKEGISATASY